MNVLPVLTCLLLTLAIASYSEEAKPTEPKVKALGDGNYSLGLIKFNENTRRISFPGEVNQIEGVLEFALVHENGKLHESLLATKASALNLNVALKLLHFKESPELFPALDENFEKIDDAPIVSDETKAAARLQILISWEKDGKKVEHPINDLIYNLFKEKKMDPIPWVYQGSYIHSNSFEAETSGDLVAIFIARSALINYPGNDNDIDEPWTPNAKLIPKNGTPVTITFAPLLDKK